MSHPEENDFEAFLDPLLMSLGVEDEQLQAQLTAQWKELLTNARMSSQKSGSNAIISLSKKRMQRKEQRQEIDDMHERPGKSYIHANVEPPNMNKVNWKAAPLSFKRYPACEQIPCAYEAIIMRSLCLFKRKRNLYVSAISLEKLTSFVVRPSGFTSINSVKIPLSYVQNMRSLS